MKCNIVTGSHFLLFCSSLQYRSALVATRMRNIILFYSWQDNRGSVGKFCPNWFFQQFSFVKIGIRDVTALCAVFLPLRLSCKESSTFLTKPLFPQGREDVTALRCSEPLRYKVGGASKPCAILCGMGPPSCYGSIVSIDEIEVFYKFSTRNLI